MKDTTRHSPTGGVLHVWLEGRTHNVWQRVSGMTPKERQWRAQFLQDQILSYKEPRKVSPELDKLRRNPIRRFFGVPFVALENFLMKRHYSPQFALGVSRGCVYLVWATIFLYAGAYNLRYNHRDWERTGGWGLTGAQTYVRRGEPGYPFVEKTLPHLYADEKFSHSKL